MNLDIHFIILTTLTKNKQKKLGSTYNQYMCVNNHIF